MTSGPQLRTRMLAEIGDLMRLWRKKDGAQLEDSLEVVAIALATLTNVPTDPVERQEIRDLARTTLSAHEQRFELQESRPKGHA